MRLDAGKSSSADTNALLRARAHSYGREGVPGGRNALARRRIRESLRVLFSRETHRFHSDAGEFRRTRAPRFVSELARKMSRAADRSVDHAKLIESYRAGDAGT
jgi:hypothetical protein